jgi:hypothetical protein
MATLLKPRLEFPAVEEWVATVISPFTKRKVEQKSSYLSSLLHRAFFLDRKPKDALIYGKAFQQVSTLEALQFASAFSTREIRSHMGGSHADYKQFLRPFWIFDEKNEGYSKVRKISKVYLLTASTLTKLYETWHGDEPAKIIDEGTGRRLTATDFPTNGICQTFKSKIHIPSIVPISLQQISALIAVEEAKHGDINGSKHPLHLRRRRVQALRYLNSDNVCAPAI